MSNLDIEKQLAQLSEDWPGRSVANSVLRRLEEQPLPMPKQKDRKASSVNQSSQHGRRLVRWLGGAAAAVALLVLGWHLSAPQTLHAALQRSLEEAKSWHIQMKSFDGNNEQGTVEAWYHRDFGMRLQHGNQITVDDGKLSHSWSTHSAAQTRVVRRPSMDGIAMISQLVNLADIPRDWQRRRTKDQDSETDGKPYFAWTYVYTGQSLAHPTRIIVWVDEDERPRKLAWQEQTDDVWTLRREMLVSYEAPVEPTKFALDYPANAKVFDVKEQLAGRFPIENALAKVERDGLLFAVHDLLPIDDRSYYVVSSVRGTSAYLKQYPPRKRRVNLDYTALDVAHQSHSHGSCGTGHKVLLHGMEWQGVDYMWYLFVPGKRQRPTNGAAEGFVRLPLFASHWHEQQKDERGVQKATRCDLDVRVNLNNTSSLEEVVAKARTDMSLVRATFNQVSSSQMAKSINSRTVQFVSFDEIDDEAYANELRKTRWQLETGDWSGGDPPDGFAAKFTEEWVEPEDATKHFKDTSFELPARAAGRVIDHEGRPIPGVAVQLKIRRRHPNKVVEQKNVIYNATTDESGQFVLELAGTLNQKYDDVQINGSKSGFVENSTDDYLKGILKGSLPELQLHRGREISGLIVDEQGHPVSDAIIRVQSSKADLSFTWDSGPRRLRNDGSFSLLVPTDSAAAGVVYPKGYAPRSFEVAADASDLGEIAVRKGIQLRGRVLDDLGQGVANTIVGVRASKYVMIHSYGVPIGMAIRTDDQGAFLLPHLDGEFVLTVSKSAPVYAERRMEVGVEPPKIAPMAINTSDVSASKSLILRP